MKQREIFKYTVKKVQTERNVFFSTFGKMLRSGRAKRLIILGKNLVIL